MENQTAKNKYHIKVLKFFTKLSLQIVILFVIGMAYSFLTQYLQSVGFFGDTHLTGRECGAVDRSWEWGTRHYLFFWMSVLLFIVQFVRIIVFGAVEREYTFDDKK